MDKSGRRPLLMISATRTFFGCFLAAMSFYLKGQGLYMEWTPRLALSGILLLADAERQINDTSKLKNEVLPVKYKIAEEAGASEPAVATSSGLPDWAKPLEQVQRLPTNVGARIKNCVESALQKNPPKWAKERLEYSISKGVYKDNACGQTKKLSCCSIANSCFF